MLNDFKRRLAVTLIRVLVTLMGLLSAVVMLTGLFITVVFAVTVASLIVVYLAIFHRRRKPRY